MESQGREDLPQLTGVRIVAALWVVLFHFGPTLTRIVPEIRGVFYFAGDGYLAVDLFFVLSGFVIAFQYFDAARDKRLPYRRFVWRRFARIYPAHLLVLLMLIVAVLGAARLGIPFRNRTYLNETGAGFDLLLVRGWAEPSQGWNFPAWSLSAEWLAYLVFPVLVLVLARLEASRRWLIGSLAALVLAEAAADALLPSFNGMPAPTPRVLIAFTSGCLAFLLQRGIDRPRASWAAFGALVLLIVAMPLLGVSPLKAALSLALCVVVVTGLAVGRGPVTRALGSPLLRWGGRASYSVYLVHGALLIVLVNVLVVPVAAPFVARLAVVIGMIALVVGVGAALFHLVERPAREGLVALVARRSDSALAGRRRAASRRSVQKGNRALDKMP